MEKRKVQKLNVPRFANEQEEARWWSGAEGRTFLKQQSRAGSATGKRGSKLVARLAPASSVQIALRLPSPDLARARTIAERKGIGYQTLLKMLVHEGLQRAEDQG
jgi:predicted DNA binding CopG/RHH family protein